MKRIAVIGAGPCGLTAIKSCKEEGLDVVCFERNGEPGGLWRYHEEDIEGVASVMKTTVINTSKEFSAFSDFPPPKELPNFMHHSNMYKYFMLYAQTFDLLKHIRYHKQVVKVVPSRNYDRTGRWIVTTKDAKDGSTEEEEFDGVLVCVGHHVFPKIPTFPGQEKFQGSIVHTHSLKHCEAYKDKRVVVVGIGNSGVDAAVDCTFVSNPVYLSTRRGSWIYTRVTENGKPYDINYSTRMNYVKSQFLSFDAQCSSLEKRLQAVFDHEMYNLKPKHRVMSAHPTVNDSLPNAILSGRIVIKGDISRFEENGIVFEGDNEVTEIDSVILATGYLVKFPFLEENIVSTKENRIHLYKYMFPPHMKHPSLAIIALSQPIGPIFPLAEQQSRWYAQVITGKRAIPSTAEMERDIEGKNKANAKRYVDSTRHTIQVDFIPFMDEISSQFGAKPSLLKMAFTDPQLFWACLNGPCFPYQYRLQGPHSWPGARDAILCYEERVMAPLNTRYSKIEEKSVQRRYSPLRMVFYSAVTAVLIWRLWYAVPNCDNLMQRIRI